MRPAGRGRGGAPGSRRSRHAGQPPLFVVGEPVEYGLCREIFGVLRGLDGVPDPLTVEMALSDVVGHWWTMPPLGGQDPDELFGGALVQFAKRQHSPLGLLVLRALAVVSPSAEVRDAAAAAAQSLMVRGVRQPAAASRIGRVTAGRCWLQEDVYGDQATVACEFSYGDQRHVFCVLVDHNLGGIAKNAFAVDEVDEAVEALRAQAEGVAPMATFREVDPGWARGLLERAVAVADEVRGRAAHTDLMEWRALLLARIRAMPQGTRAHPGPEPEQQQELVAGFLASPEAKDLEDHDAAEHVATWFVEFGSVQDPARPVRISPSKLELFLHHWLPRHAVLGGAERAAVPATVRALVAWAGRRADLPRQAREDLATAAKEMIDELESEALMSEARRRRTTKAAPAPAKRAPSGRRAPTGAYQIKVSLRGAKPPIWRRLKVPASVTLADLHRVLQYAMGWDDYHLHAFEVGEMRYGVPDPELELRNEARVRLRDVAATEGFKFRYEYDFGDGWEHDIVVEKILDEPVKQPVLLAGRRACPPEDCGGIWGYAHLLGVLADPQHEEHEELSTWVGGRFDPNVLDITGINELLGVMNLGRRA